MEKRRKALGLRKLVINNDDDNITKTSSAKRSTSCDEEKKPDGRRPESRQSETPRTLRSSVFPRENLAPKQTTPKNHHQLAAVTAESPESPFGANLHVIDMHKMFGSPEIEVSWDWGCSQVVSETVPKKRFTKASQPSPVPVSDFMMTYPRRPPSKELSEEENQERLAFYKSILSKSLKRNPNDPPKNNNNVDADGKNDSNRNNTTPKRPTNHEFGSAKVEDATNLFDDSANDFMLECSQAIEEQLRNEEISNRPVVNIDIRSKKHPHSPALEVKGAAKKVCHMKTKQKLFPDSPVHIQEKSPRLSLKSPKNERLNVNSNCEKTKNKGLNVNLNFEKKSSSNKVADDTSENDDDRFTRPTQPNIRKKCLQKENAVVPENGKILVSCEVSKNINSNVQSADLKARLESSVKEGKDSVAGKKINENAKEQLKRPSFNNNNLLSSGNLSKGSGNTLNYDSVNKFRRSQNSVFPKNQQKPPTNEKTLNNSTASVSSLSKSTVNETKSTQNDKAKPSVILRNSEEVTRPKSMDVTHLLDDGFDMDLCTLDFDYLCCNGENKSEEPQSKVLAETVPKQCSEQEIEAKRLAALNKLMMKKKR